MGNFSFDWSVDGSMIAYSNVDTLGSYDSIWIMNQDGSGKKKIIEFPYADATEPSW